MYSPIYELTAADTDIYHIWPCTASQSFPFDSLVRARFTPQLCHQLIVIILSITFLTFYPICPHVPKAITSDPPDNARRKSFMLTALEGPSKDFLSTNLEVVWRWHHWFDTTFKAVGRRRKHVSHKEENGDTWVPICGQCLASLVNLPHLLHLVCWSCITWCSSRSAAESSLYYGMEDGILWDGGLFKFSSPALNPDRQEG